MMNKLSKKLVSLRNFSCCLSRNIDLETTNEYIEDFFSELREGEEVCLLKKKRNSRLGDHSYRENKKKLNISYLDHVIVDEESKTVDLGPFAEMGDIIDELLAQGYRLPITTDFMHHSVGGLICGMGIESSSTFHGLFHEVALEYDFYSPTQGFIKINKESHPELWNCVPGSFGSFGILTNVKMRLCSSGSGIIKIDTEIYDDFGDCMNTMVENMVCKEYEFCEGVGFDIGDSEKEKFVVMKGTVLQEDDNSIEIRTTKKRSDDFFYDQVDQQMVSGESYYYPLRDYYERWEQAFFHLPEFYLLLDWKEKLFFELQGLKNYLQKKPFKGSCRDLYTYSDLLTPFSKKIPLDEMETMTQDIIVPVSEAEEFYEFAMELQKSEDDGPFLLPRALWICPFDCREMPEGSLFVPNSDMFVDLGFYGRTRRRYESIDEAREFNERMETQAIEMGGSQFRCNISYLQEEEYWKMCGLCGMKKEDGDAARLGKEYFEKLKDMYDKGRLFPSPFEKTSGTFCNKE